MSILAVAADERVAEVETTDDELIVRLWTVEKLAFRSSGIRGCSTQQPRKEKTGE
jgi:hypothetical protein